MAEPTEPERSCVRCGHPRPAHGTHPRYPGQGVCGAVVASSYDGVVTPDYCGCVGFLTEWPKRNPGDPLEVDFVFSFPAQGLVKPEAPRG